MKMVNDFIRLNNHNDLAKLKVLLKVFGFNYRTIDL